MGMKSLFGAMKIWGMAMMVVQRWNELNATELHT